MWRFVLQMLGMFVGVIVMFGIWLVAQVLAPHNGPSLGQMLEGIVSGTPASLVFYSGLGIALIGFGFFVRDTIRGYIRK